MTDAAQPAEWRALLSSGRAFALLALLAGVLLYAMNALLMSTVLPSAVGEIGGLEFITWPTAAFLASSIAAATGAGLLKARVGARRAYALAAGAFAAGALICWAAPSMGVLIAGRLVQGLGGGLLSALAYVMVRALFEEALWARAFALITGAWGVAVLIGPLVGGIFAGAGYWRGAFFAVAACAGALAVLALIVLPRDGAAPAERASFPALRLALVAGAILAMASAGVASSFAATAALIAASLAILALMLRIDRARADKLLPSDAFSARTILGAGLWMVLLMSVANDPFPIYGPLFLQRLHGFDPLTAGYIVALEALSWTLTATATAHLSARWNARLLIGGPAMMALGLAGIGLTIGRGPLWALFVSIYFAGGGIGACWALVARRIMNAARADEEDIAAAAVPAVQLFGLSFGAAIAGLIAHLAGLAPGAGAATMASASVWVIGCFALSALGAAAAGARTLILANARENAP